MRAALTAAGVAMPANRLWLVAIKDAKRLDLYGQDAAGRRVQVRSWAVLAASGGAGPKLREGDRQVPEGVYRIDQLNPNSAYHLSLRIDYPNAVDRAQAARDGRQRLGGDIFIHGKDVSVGCLAIGDEAIEELFWLAATVGKDAFTVVIAPTDLRRGPPPGPRGPAWILDLYRDLQRELEQFPAT
ncbi:MAG: L,D-transpeptidase family protein [Deltaproteobacteria bacterium]|nr:L,D-transpeptidase family protein [Deltaproteobacteria bacterium]